MRMTEDKNEKWERLKLILDIYEHMDTNDKGYAWLTENPEMISAQYEGRLQMIKMIKEAIEKIENGEW